MPGGRRWFWPIVVHVLTAVAADTATADATDAASNAAEYVSSKNPRSKPHRASGQVPTLSHI